MRTLLHIGFLSLLAPIPQAAPPDPSEAIFIETDREAARLLLRADDAARESEWETAVRLYDQLLGHERSAEFLYHVDEGLYRGVKGACRDRLLALPAEGLLAYRSRVDPEARTALDEARRSGDPGRARVLIERYPASSVVSEALDWSGSYSLDHGLYADATWALSRRLEEDLPDDLRASILVRLGICHIRSGDWMGARAILDRLDGLKDSGAPLGGDIRDAAEVLRGLIQEGSGRDGRDTGHAGDPTTIRADDWGIRWAHRISDYFQRGDEVPPARIHPVTNDGDVFFHDGNHAYRLDLPTGRLVWKVQTRPGGFSYRLPTRDCLTLVGKEQIFTSSQGEALLALDRESGDLLWRADAAAIRADLDLGFPVHLSASLAQYGGTLFAAVTSIHAEAEVFLVALEAETGKALWSRFVASRTGPAHREATLYRDGVRLYLLSGIGVTAAFDIPDGNLRWLRARSEIQETPSLLASSGVLHILFRGSRPLLHQVDPSSGDLLRAAAAPGIDALFGFPGGEVLGAGPERIGLLRERWNLATRGGSGEARHGIVVDRHLLLPGETGIVSVDTTGESDPLVEWGVGGRGVLAEAEGILMSAAANGLFAYAASGPPPGRLPVGLSVGELVGRLGDGSWGVRDQAFRRLAAMGPEAIAEIASERLSEDAEVRWRVSEIVYEIDRKHRMAVWRDRIPPFLLEKQPELLAWLTHRDRAVRMEGLNVISSEGGREVAFLLKDLIVDRDWGIRFGAARGLLRLGDRSGFPIIEESLRSEVVEERRQALKVIAEAGGPEDAELCRRLLADEEPRVRRAAFRALESLIGSLALSGSAEILLGDSDDRVRLDLVRSARKHGGRVGVDILRRAMADGSQAVRMESLLGIEKLYTPSSAGAVAKALLDESRVISARAAQILFRQAQKVGAHLIPTDLLEKAGESENENLRFDVVQILEVMSRRKIPMGRITGEEGGPGPRMRSGVRALLRAAEDENPNIRERALRALGPLVERQDVPAIARLLKLELVRDRRAVTRMLVRLEDPGANDALIEALADADPEMREMARVALASLADEATAARLLTMSLHPETPGGGEAGQVLRLLSRRRLAPGLILALEDADPQVRSEAIRRLLPMAGETMGYDATAEDRAGAVRRWKAWWYLQDHSDVSLVGVIRDLGDPNPRVRYAAAEVAAHLPEEKVIQALIEGLEGEAVRWVLRQKIEALRAATGEEFGYDRKAPESERRAALGRWVEWWEER